MADPPQPESESQPQLPPKLRRPSGPREPLATLGVPTAPFPIKLSGPIVKGFGRGSRELGIPTANIPPSTLTDANQSSIPSGVYYGLCSLPIAQPSISTSPAFPDPSIPLKNSLIPTSYPAPIPVIANKGKIQNQDHKSPSHTETTTPLTSISASPTVSSTSQSSQSTQQQQAGVVQRRHGQANTTTTIFHAVLSIGYNPFYANRERSIEVHIMHAFPQQSFDLYELELRIAVLGFIRPEYDYDGLDALIEDIWCDVGVAQRSLERDEEKRYLLEDDDETEVGRWLRGVIVGADDEKKKDHEEKKGRSD